MTTTPELKKLLERAGFSPDHITQKLEMSQLFEAEDEDKADELLRKMLAKYGPDGTDPNPEQVEKWKKAHATSVAMIKQMKSGNEGPAKHRPQISVQDTKTGKMKSVDNHGYNFDIYQKLVNFLESVIANDHISLMFIAEHVLYMMIKDNYRMDLWDGAALFHTDDEENFVKDGKSRIKKNIIKYDFALTGPYSDAIRTYFRTLNTDESKEAEKILLQLQHGNYKITGQVRDKIHSVETSYNDRDGNPFIKHTRVTTPIDKDHPLSTKF